MQAVTISKITESLQNLSDEKLVVVFDFISYLAERELNQSLFDAESKAIDCMHASEQILAKDWNLSEEEDAWANL